MLQTKNHKNMWWQAKYHKGKVWVAQYHGLLRLPLPKEIHIIGYADDIVVTLVAVEIRKSEHLCNHAAIKIKE